MAEGVADATLFVGALAKECMGLPRPVRWRVTMEQGQVELSMGWEARDGRVQRWGWGFLSRAPLHDLDRFAVEAVAHVFSLIRPPAHV